MLPRTLVLPFVVAAGCARGPVVPPPPAPLEVPKLQTRPGASTQPPRDAADRQATPESARDYAIELLEREQYEELIVKLLSPKELEKMKDREGGLAKIVGEFSTSEKRTELLELLRRTRDTRSETTEEGHVKFPTPGKSRGITFEQVEGRWYIRN